MCGRYSWAQKKKLALPQNLPLPPPPASVSYNRAPGQDHPVIIRRNQAYAWTFAKWGLITEQKQANSIPNPINARIETVREKPIFQNSVEQRRCLVPADGYFEWQKLETQKYPHFHVLNNRDTFAMAGIWNETKKGDQSNQSFTILTHSASPNLLHIHHRMPVILQPEDWTAWLAAQTDLDLFLNRYAQCKQSLEAYQVSSQVNKVQHNGPELTEEFTEKQTTLW